MKKSIKEKTSPVLCKKCRFKNKCTGKENKGCHAISVLTSRSQSNLKTCSLCEDKGRVFSKAENGWLPCVCSHFRRIQKYIEPLTELDFSATQNHPLFLSLPIDEIFSDTNISESIEVTEMGRGKTEGKLNNTPYNNTNKNNKKRYSPLSYKFNRDLYVNLKSGDLYLTRNLSAYLLLKFCEKKGEFLTFDFLSAYELMQIFLGEGKVKGRYTSLLDIKVDVLILTWGFSEPPNKLYADVICQVMERQRGKSTWLFAKRLASTLAPVFEYVKSWVKIDIDGGEPQAQTKSPLAMPGRSGASTVIGNIRRNNKDRII